MNKKTKRYLGGCIALAVVVLSAPACTKTSDPADGGPGGPSGDPAIEFNIGMQASRATQTTTSSLDRIGVFGYSTPQSGWVDASKATYSSDYFLNKMVVRMETSPNVWWYDGPVKYWPADDEGLLSFFAYAPFIDVHDIYTLYPGAVSQKGSPTIAYVPPADAIRQVDLLWDKKVDLDRYSYSGAVRFEMKHALTSIAFEAQVEPDINHFDAPYTVEVLSVGLGNVVAGGVFDLNDGQWAFDPITDASQLASYRLTPEEHKGLEDVTFHCQYDPATTPGYTDPFSGFVPLGKSYATLMLLPQDFRDGTETVPDYPTTVSITYRTINLLTGDEDVITQEIELASHPTASLNKWEKGKGITYQFTISLFDGVAVRVKVGAFIEADKWQPGGEDTIGVG